MYAIIKTGGKQVKSSSEFKQFAKTQRRSRRNCYLDQVVLVGGESTKVGTPLVEGAL